MTDDLSTRLLAAIDDFGQHEPGADRVLRLCKAHREIVRQFRRAWDRRDEGNEREVLIRQARAIAFIDVLHTLATAYDIQERP